MPDNRINIWFLDIEKNPGLWNWGELFWLHTSLSRMALITASDFEFTCSFL